MLHFRSRLAAAAKFGNEAEGIQTLNRLPSFLLFILSIVYLTDSLIPVKRMLKYQSVVRQQRSLFGRNINFAVGIQLVWLADGHIGFARQTLRPCAVYFGLREMGVKQINQYFHGVSFFKWAGLGGFRMGRLSRQGGLACLRPNRRKSAYASVAKGHSQPTHWARP